MKNRTLDSEKLQLEPLNINHAPEMFEVLKDPLIYQYIPDMPPSSLEVLIKRYKFLSDESSSESNQLWFNWLIRIKNTNECAGYIQATTYPDNTGDFAFVLSSKYWGQGIAYEASLLAMDFLQKQHDIKELYATVSNHNNRSIKLLSRLKFEERDHKDYPHGEAEVGDKVFFIKLEDII